LQKEAPLAQLDASGRNTIRYFPRHAIPSIASIAFRIDDMAQAWSA
jgi:hypothetical protein